MKRRAFGSSGLQMSEIGFGGSRIGGLLAGGTAHGALSTLQAALDAGINVFDTADMYAQGEGEQLIGRAFAKCRSRVIIITKVGYVLPARRRLLAALKPLVRPVMRSLGVTRRHLPAQASGALTQNFTAAYIARAAEASLRRLRTDYIDVYLLHSPPPAVIASDLFLEAVHALGELQRAGKIRNFGVAADSIADALVAAKRSTVQAVELPFGLLDADAHGGLTSLHEDGIGVIARGAFGGGLLKASHSPTELRRLTPKADWILALRALAEQKGRTLLELAVQLSLRAHGPSTTLLGMRTVKHVMENVRHSTAPALTDAECAACRELAARYA